MTRKSHSKQHRNPHAEITAKILAELEQGVAPWVKPWQMQEQAGHVMIPHNAATGRAYNGGNVFMVWLEMLDKGWTYPAFVTFKQALECGGNVRKGERGMAVYYVGQFTPKDDQPADDDDARKVTFLRRATVFNVEQCEGLDLSKVTLALDPATRGFPGAIGEFYRTVAAKVMHGGNMPVYVQARDMIIMPEPERFATRQDYHATRLHETGHWTGAPHRLARDFSGKFGDQAYAAEELVAELTAALLCAELGIVGRLQHAEYIGHWIRLLQDHERAFMAAASKAQAAVSYLRDLCLQAAEPEPENVTYLPALPQLSTGHQFTLPMGN